MEGALDPSLVPLFVQLGQINESIEVAKANLLTFMQEQVNAIMRQHSIIACLTFGEGQTCFGSEPRGTHEEHR